jgi:hypothetical protein
MTTILTNYAQNITARILVKCSEENTRKKVRESSNVVVLDPDVAEAFPNAQAVNETLRRLIELAKANVHFPPQE